MAITIRDPNVYYEGKTFPADAAPIQTPVTDPNIPYNGKVLPKDTVKPVPFSDPLNTPGTIILNNGTQQMNLPPDTTIILMGKKILAQTTILDGVSVFERIMRDPYEIEFEGTFRMQNINGTNYNNTTPPAGLKGIPNNVWPQQYLNDFWNYIWIPNTVLIIKNSYLNGLGVQQVIVESVHPQTIRGTKNIPFKIKCWENVPGQSLIIA